MAMNVGQLARALIRKYPEMKNEDLAKKVVSIFEEHDVNVKTSAACIAWYKNDMRKKGELIGTAQRKAIEIDLEDI